MLQTIVIVILLIIDGAIVLTNPSVFQTALTFAAPGTANLTVVVTIRDLMIAAGGALVLAWVAALIDRAALDRRVQRHERTMRVMSDEMVRVKARVYDEERRPLEDIRVKLDTLDRDIRGLRARIDREPPAQPADARAAAKNPSEAA